MPPSRPSRWWICSEKCKGTFKAVPGRAQAWQGNGMRLRRKAREIALQVLYQLDVLRIEPKEGDRSLLEYISAPQSEARAFASELVEGTWAHRDEIDLLISTCSENWSLERMARVDRNILRLAVYELLYSQGHPPQGGSQRSHRSRQRIRLRKFGFLHQRHPGCPVRETAERSCRSS